MSTDTIIEKDTVTDRDLKEPPRYKVLVLNDNVTPMEFVIVMLMKVFKHNENSAYDLTMHIHNNGNAVAGIYSHEVAEQKVSDAVEMARANNFPLALRAEAE
jgi:ATP-dependent Clp protease adaptor protein ClpS